MKPWTPKLLRALQLALKGGVEIGDLADLTGHTVAEIERACALLRDHQPAAALTRLNAAPAIVSPTAFRPPVERPIVVPPPPFLGSCRPTRRNAPDRSLRIAPSPMPRTQALKPVTQRVARWSWWFVAAGWALDDVAALFDRDPAALDRAVEALA